MSSTATTDTITESADSAEREATTMTFHDFSQAQAFATGRESSNFDYVVDYPWNDQPDKAAIWYIARPNSGCVSGYFGDLNHVKKLIRQGFFDGNLTPLGNALIEGVIW